MMADENSEQPVKRGRGRPKKQPYVPLGDKPAQELLETIDEARRQEIFQAEKRAAMARSLAKYRWGVAQHYHRLKDGSKMDFTSRPYQPAILQDDGTDIVISGSAQFGKSETLICHAVACAGICGMQVMWVISKEDKLQNFVKDRIDPSFSTVPAYKKMYDAAKARGAKSDNTSLKHFGDGSIIFLYATANRNFTSYPADACIIDEHQECDQDNIKKVNHRMAASDWGFLMRVGHPDVEGTEDNGNLDYLLQNSTKNLWMVPCPTCRKTVELDWFRHCVFEERNKFGGILSVKPRDQEWRPGSPLDMRPICDECHRPMNRLSKQGFWEPQNPGHIRHGYNLGNLYNPSAMCRLSVLYDEYIGARNSPSQMKEFYNKSLGKPYSLSSDKISESMLNNCASGSSGVVPYRFVKASMIQWKKVDENPEGVLVPA